MHTKVSSLVKSPNQRLAINVKLMFENDFGEKVAIARSEITVYQCSAIASDNRCTSCLDHNEWNCFWNLASQSCIDEKSASTMDFGKEKCPRIEPWRDPATGGVQRIQSGMATKVNIKIDNQNQLNKISESSAVSVYKCLFFQDGIGIGNETAQFQEGTLGFETIECAPRVFGNERDWEKELEVKVTATLEGPG